MNLYGLKRIRKMIGLQVLVVLGLALILLVMRNSQEAFSALLGGVCSIVPSMLFALRHFQYEGAQAAPQILKSFYRAEVLKIVTSIVLISIVLLVFHVKPFGFLITYMLIVMTAWVAPLVLNEK